MAYIFYLDGMELPITPSKLDIKIKNNNRTLNLINEGEVNILKLPALTEINFDILVPQVKYPFAKTSNSASTYLGKLESLKTSKKPFQFIVTRTSPSGQMLFNTNIKVSLEEYEIIEDANEGLDLQISVSLKQYREFSTKTVKVTIKQEKFKIRFVESHSSPSNTKKRRTHKVVKGDCLWNISKKYLGKGSRYREIYNLNRDKIKNPNLIYPGQILVLP